jgi:hypothetical protein
MTPDEARNLMGGYATGSLTEAEEKALFAAALEDQELFEELADQQAIKEVLNEPGARQRLLAALEPPSHKAAWSQSPWPWATGAVAIAIAIGIVISQRTPPPPQQIAQVTKAEESAAAPVAPPPPVKQKTAPAPAPQPPVELQKKAEVLADKVEEAKPAPPAPEQEAAQARDGAARGGRARGFAAGAPAAAALRSDNLAVSGFGFTYAIRADGFLEIVPLAPGFLSVTTSAGVVFPSGAVSAGTPVRIPIPADAASLVVSFSRTPAVTGSPVRRDDASGTVTDQDPPNGRIVIELFRTPAPR